jgi:heme-degrading monooxygenase HmoA
MINRIVQMTFREECVPEFLQLFAERKATIRGFHGCTHLELLRDNNHPNVFFTYSKWETEDDLNHYRFSEFFKDTWGKTKALFAEKANAWSLVEA